MAGSYWDLSTVMLIVIVLVWLLRQLKKKYVVGPVYQGMETMAGKTVVITGANTGMGKETVKHLAMRGARVVMGCRDMQKAEKAHQEIMALTNNQNIACRKLDLASFESIRAFAKGVLESESRIDVLINNAGLMFCDRCVTDNGLESHMGVNHFGHFLLTNLLLDRLKESSPSRIINVSSDAHEFGAMNFDDLHSEKSYSRFRAYCQSKLANNLHMLELSNRLKGTGVTVNSLHPGLVDTSLGQHIPVLKTPFGQTLLYPLKKLFAKSPWQGIQTLLRLAVDPKLQNVTGKYFYHLEVKVQAPQALNADDAKRLWDIGDATTSEKKDN